MLRIDASCVLQNVLARIVRGIKTLALQISLSSSNLMTCLERDCYGKFLELCRRGSAHFVPPRWKLRESHDEGFPEPFRGDLVAFTLAVFLELASPVI